MVAGIRQVDNGQLQAAEGRVNRVEACEACGVQFVRLKHERTGNFAPIEFEPAENGNVIPLNSDGRATVAESAISYRIKRKAEQWNVKTDGPLFLNHFASCPSAARFHRKAAAAS